MNYCSSANLLIKSYQIRLGIETEECVEYIYSDKTIGPRSVDDMVTSGYRPDAPTDLSVHNMPGDLTYHEDDIMKCLS